MLQTMNRGKDMHLFTIEKTRLKPCRSVAAMVSAVSPQASDGQKATFWFRYSQRFIQGKQTIALKKQSLQ
ncbi:MAG: hypothetical protein GX115_14325 [Ruminiclostridium sp.]|nr:hypothetical protein [Ruminiclostridium sp.]